MSPMAEALALGPFRAFLSSHCVFVKTIEAQTEQSPRNNTRPHSPERKSSVLRIPNSKEQRDGWGSY